ncbi:MAG TPA: STN domain-containing protein [Anaeromyxobacteraceae bacterium]|nr:STN domain-containing protein [Anaeromyxobacteraceae bacterium]
MLSALLVAVALAAPPPPPAPPAPVVAGTPAMPRPPRAPGAPVAPASRLNGDWPEKPSGARVSLTDGKMTVDRALRKIADAAGWSLVANTGRAGDRTLVITLRDVPVEDALVAVLEGTPLAATRRGTTVTVAPGLPPPVETPVLTGFSTPSGKKVTASFSDTPVDKALLKIAEAGEWSIVLPPGLRGAVNASFRATPVEDALKAVLTQSGLSASRDGAVVTVSRESGPRIVIRGDKRRLVFDADGEMLTEDIQGIADEARKAAKDALKDLNVQVADGGAAAEEATDRARDKVVSGDVNIGPGERWRDVVALRGNVRMGPGSAARQVTAVLGSVELEPGATVEREAVAVGGNVHVATGSHVGGDAVSVGGEVSIDQGGVVDGQEVSVSVPGIGSLVGLASPKPSTSSGLSAALHVGRAIAKFVVFFLLALLLRAVMPARLDRVTASLTRAPLRDVLVGLLGTVAMPVLTVLLAVTIVGILLIPVQLIAILLAAILGYTALAMLIGRAIPVGERKGEAVIQLALGTAIVVLVSEIPFVGVLAMISAWLLVFGAVLRSRGGQPPAATPPMATTTTTMAPSQGA